MDIHKARGSLSVNAQRDHQRVSFGFQGSTFPLLTGVRAFCLSSSGRCRGFPYPINSVLPK